MTIPDRDLSSSVRESNALRTRGPSRTISLSPEVRPWWIHDDELTDVFLRWALWSRGCLESQPVMKLESFLVDCVDVLESPQKSPIFTLQSKHAHSGLFWLFHAYKKWSKQRLRHDQTDYTTSKKIAPQSRQILHRSHSKGCTTVIAKIAQLSNTDSIIKKKRINVIHCATLLEKAPLQSTLHIFEKAFDLKGYNGLRTLWLEFNSLEEDSLEAEAWPESTLETEARSRANWSLLSDWMPKWASNLALYWSIRVEKSL